jgi:membrane protease YdiL (CAAX protease family)
MGKAMNSTDARRPGAATEPPFAELAAQGRHEWWRYALGVLVVVLASGIGGAAGLMVLRLGPGLTDDSALVSFIAIMFSFPVTGAVVLAALPRLHRRPWRGLITGRQAFDIRGALLGCAVTFALLALAALAELALAPGHIEVNFRAGAFFLYLPFVVLLTPLQVLAEEVVFRGYVLQLVAHITRLTVLRVALPALLFALLHFGNPDVVAGGVWGILDISLVAAYFTYLALRGNGLEHAAGFHLGLNLFGFIVMTSPNPGIETPAILLDTAPDFALGFAVTLLVCVLHYRIVFRRGRGRGMVGPG